jgi:hypothetical protein
MGLHDTSGNTGVSKPNESNDNYDTSCVERAKSRNDDEKVTYEDCIENKINVIETLEEDLERFMHYNTVKGLAFISTKLENELDMYIKLLVLLYADDTALTSQTHLDSHAQYEFKVFVRIFARAGI